VAFSRATHQGLDMAQELATALGFLGVLALFTSPIWIVLLIALLFPSAKPMLPCRDHQPIYATRVFRCPNCGRL
jgi:predicted metal-binding membrane protein